jgi:NADPH:quinone reductase-like Zn-dependent oxidoreductase
MLIKARNLPMKALTYREYGSLDVLHYGDTERPTPADDEVLIQVRAVSLNRSDLEIVGGMPLYTRIFGLFKPSHQILGSDIAGTVVEVGSKVMRLAPGDNVYGDTMGTFGGFAEFACAKEKVLFKKPAGLSFEQISTIPQAGIIALQGLEWNGGVRPGDRVLINGAGGGSGMFAIQMAKLMGAHVTAIDNERKLDHMRSLGADVARDYQEFDFVRSGEKYDHILDLVATRSSLTHSRALNPGGRYAMVGGELSVLFDHLILGKLIGGVSRKKIGLLAATPNERDFERIVDLILQEKVRITIDKVFPLAQAVEALRYTAEGRALGKVVIQVPE